jgi:hypothetical protein
VLVGRVVVVVVVIHGGPSLGIGVWGVGSRCQVP